MGGHVGQRIVDVLFIRERNTKREIRLINVLVFIKSSVWKALFSKEADNLESATDDETTCKFAHCICTMLSIIISIALFISYRLHY